MEGLTSSPQSKVLSLQTQTLIQSAQRISWQEREQIMIAMYKANMNDLIAHVKGVLKRDALPKHHAFIDTLYNLEADMTYDIHHTTSDIHHDGSKKYIVKMLYLYFKDGMLLIQYNSNREGFHHVLNNGWVKKGHVKISPRMCSPEYVHQFMDIKCCRRSNQIKQGMRLLRLIELVFRHTNVFKMTHIWCNKSMVNNNDDPHVTLFTQSPLYRE